MTHVDPAPGNAPGGTIVKTIKPIFFLFTASFWLGIFPTIITALDFVFSYFSGPEGGPLSMALASVLSAFGADVTGEDIAGLIQKMYPLYFFLFAWQRGTFTGQLPRPYTADKSKADIVTRVVENGSTAFEAGKIIGAGIRDKLTPLRK